MPSYTISVPNNAETIKIRVNKSQDYITSFDKSLAGKSVYFNTDGLGNNCTIYFTSNGRQVVWDDATSIK
jgi:hypothetical protein